MGANRIGFDVYIANSNFHIPLYQREFVWKSEQALGFLDEIIKLHSDNVKNSKIFCGTAYLKPNKENTWDVIDGQQRTTFLYGVKLAVIERAQKLMKGIDDLSNKRDEELIKDFKKLLPRISSFEITTARSENDDSFENQLKNKTGKIINVFDDIKDRIDEYIENDLKENPIDTIDFILSLFTNVELIEVKVEEYDDINDIFKSINSKGKKLSTWDIIRNDIYRNSSSGDDTLENIDDSLSVLEQEYHIKSEEFIRGYIMSKVKDYVSKSKVLKNFDIVNEKRKPEGIDTDIDEFMKKLKSFDSDKTKSNVNYIKYFFKVTKELGQTQIRTFSIALLLSWGFENEVPKEMKKLLVNSVIFMKLGKGRANIIEKFLIQNSKEIFKSKEKLDKFINESEFKKTNDDHFKNKDILKEIEQNHSLLKLLLWLKTPKSEFTAVMKALDFEYEHVLPKKNNLWLKEYSYWENVKSKIANEYLDKIGNIILIHKSLNAKIKNSIFKEKIKWYLESKIDNKENEYYIFTKNLSLDKDLKFLEGLYDIKYGLIWNPKLVEERTKKISELIFKTLEENY